MARWLLVVAVICLIGAAGVTFGTIRAQTNAARHAVELAAALQALEAQQLADRTRGAPDTLQPAIERWRAMLASARYHEAGWAQSRAGLCRWNGPAAVLTLAGGLLIAGAVFGLRRLKPVAGEIRR